MYKTIVNPITNRKVNINTKLGQKIITNYLLNTHTPAKGGYGYGHGFRKGRVVLSIRHPMPVPCSNQQPIENGNYLCPITMDVMWNDDYLQTPDGICYSRYPLCEWLQLLENNRWPLLDPLLEHLIWVS